MKWHEVDIRLFHLAGLLIFFFLCYWLLFPLENYADRIQQNEQLRRQLQRAMEVERERPLVLQDIAELRRQLETFQPYLIESEQQLAETIIWAASRNSVQVEQLQIDRSKAVSRDHLLAQPFSASFAGGYSAVRRALNDLLMADKIIRLEQVTISSQNGRVLMKISGEGYYGESVAAKGD